MATRFAACLLLILALQAASRAEEDLEARTAALLADEDALRAEERRVEAAQRRAFELAGELEALRARKAELEADPALRARMKELVGALGRATSQAEVLGAPEQRQAREARAAALATRYAALLAELDAAIEAAPEAPGPEAPLGDPALRLCRGELLAGKSQWGPARADAERAVVARPDDPRALLLLGRTLVPENRFREAEGLFAQARRRADSDPLRAAHTLALWCLNRFAEARAARQAIADPAALPGWLQGWWLDPQRLESAARAWEDEQALRAAEAARDDLPRVALVTSRGELVLELFEDHAPHAVAAFLELVEAGFYDGLLWHKVVPNLLAQTGDPRTREGAPEGTGPGPGWRVQDEDPARQPRGCFRGAVGLVRSAQPDSAGSQLSIAVTPRLEGLAPPTVFGRVVEGLRALDALRPGDRVERARVLRKRDHPYQAPKREGDR